MPEVSGQAYRLASWQPAAGPPRAGIVVDARLLDLVAALADDAAAADLPAPVTVLAILARWTEWHPRLCALARHARDGAPVAGAQPLAGVRFAAPILHPGTIFCAGANYRDHVEEMSRALGLPPEPDPHELGLKPWHFIKASLPCVRGPGDRIELPAYARNVDWEAEIALVIGRECRNSSIADAMHHVAGLTIANDLSARDHLRRPGVAPTSPFHYDWVSQKSFEGALPIGPWITPLDQAGDPGNLAIRLWVNDELMQDSSSSNLIFSMAEQVAHLSTRVTLRPGDLVATGTPAGVGAARGRFLQAGDRVRIDVENIGTLSNEFTR